MRLLAVEDNEDDLLLLRRWLRDSGIPGVDCQPAGTLGEAIDLARGRIFDLVLLDLGLPDTHGLETFLGFQAAVPDQVVIVLTGAVDEDVALAAIRAGAQDCLDKGSMRGPALRRAISYAAERRRILDRTRVQARALEAAANGIIITNVQGVIASVNPAFTDLIGRSAEDLIGRTARTFRSKEHPADFYAAMWATIAAGRVWKGRVVNLHSDGTRVPTDLTITPVLGDDGTIQHFIGIYEDLREREHLESSLRQGEKMRAIGQLAGGVAHDFNNLLTVLVGHATLALHAGTAGDPVRRRMEVILETCERAGRLTSQLLAFGRRQLLQPRQVNLNRIVTGVRDLIERLIGEDIRIRMDLADDLWHCTLDPHLIEQVLLNLSANARDAMPGGGELRFRTRNREIDEAYARVHHPMRAGDFVELTVSDTGIGMSEDVRAQVFEPFFTTKAVGKGTGLGLASVYGTVKQSQGFIWVSSEPGKGASFKLYFPRDDAPESASVSALARPAAMVHGRGQRVLLVEDSPSVRGIIEETLALGSYRVTVAASGDAAIAAASSLDGVDLLITDLVMPGLPVPDLIADLRQRFPAMQILILSGYPFEMVERKGVDMDRCRFQEKPFKPAALLQVVNEMLGHAPT